MKYLFHVLLILLAAFIISGLYEVYVVRDGNIAVNDIFQRTIQENGGWDKILMGEGTMTLSGLVKTFSGSNNEEVHAGDFSENGMINYSSGSLNPDQAATYLASALSERYSVIEFCTPSVKECRDSYKQKMKSFFGKELPGSMYTQKPYVLNFDGIDAKVRAGLECIDILDHQEYLDKVYDINKLNIDKLIVLVKKMKIDDFDSCIQKVNNRFQLSSAMREAKSTFNLKSLPSYVILDSEEGRWITIPGLYKKDEIGEVIEKEFPVKK